MMQHQLQVFPAAIGIYLRMIGDGDFSFFPAKRTNSSASPKYTPSMAFLPIHQRKLRHIAILPKNPGI